MMAMMRLNRWRLCWWWRWSWWDEDGDLGCGWTCCRGSCSKGCSPSLSGLMWFLIKNIITVMIIIKIIITTNHGVKGRIKGSPAHHLWLSHASCKQGCHFHHSCHHHHHPSHHCHCGHHGAKAWFLRRSSQQEKETAVSHRWFVVPATPSWTRGATTHYDVVVYTVDISTLLSYFTA